MGSPLLLCLFLRSVCPGFSIYCCRSSTVCRMSDGEFDSLLPAISWVSQSLWQVQPLRRPFDASGYSRYRNLPDLNFRFRPAAMGIRDAFGPFHGYFHRFHVEDPIPTDQFLGLHEWPVDHRAFFSREFDACTLRARFQPCQFHQDACLLQLLSILLAVSYTHLTLPT